MAQQIDELSALIGALREQNAQAKEDRERLEKKLDAALATVSTIRADVDSMKNRGIGMILGISLASSVVGANVAPWLKKIIPAALGVAILLAAASLAA